MPAGPISDANWLLEDEEQVARFDDGADLDEDVFHGGLARAVDRGFHLHRFNR